MACSYELGFALTYVPKWNYIDAVREIFQNALDEETQNDNTMYFDYNKGEQTIEIGNKDSILEVKTLLLGVTSKAENEDTIGQFGEGYKLALMVLLREGKKVTIYNYGNKEIWTPKIVNSRRYGCQIVQVDVENTVVWKETPNNNLVIKIEGITSDDFTEIQDKNLHLYGDYEKIDTPKGEILTDNEFKGKIFVKGLYVCNCESYKYGYNFNPSELQLDRDRKLVSDSVLRMLASRMWNSVGNESEEIALMIVDMLKNDDEDIKYVENIYSSEINKNIAKVAYDDFKETHGEDAVPVSYWRNRNEIHGSYKKVNLPTALEKVITCDARFEEPTKVMILKETSSALEKLQLWFDKIKYCMDEYKRDKFEEIYQELEAEFEFNSGKIIELDE